MIFTHGPSSFIQISGVKCGISQPFAALKCTHRYPYFYSAYLSLKCSLCVPLRLETNTEKLQVIEDGKTMDEIPEWFQGSRLNFAENLLQHRDDRVAIYAASK